MRIRIRGPSGQFVIVLPPETATIADLESQITEKTSLSKFELKQGYPPKSLSFEEYPSTTRLVDIGLKLEEEQLTLDEGVPNLHESLALPNAPAEALTSSFNDGSFSANVGIAHPSPQVENKPLSSDQDAPELPVPTHRSTLVLRVMPDDNSCLFRAFGTAFFGAMDDNMHELRSLVAQYIQANKEKYPAVVLEKDPDEYCRWIQAENSWGGAIELDILSRHFEIEICSIDVESLRTDKFNEGRDQRCILVYSGIHYDTIALSPSDPPHKHANNPAEFDTKTFSSTDNIILETAVELCRELQKRKYYTNTGSFSLKCNTCGMTCFGEQEAQVHAQRTGHWDFAEK